MEVTCEPGVITCQGDVVTTCDATGTSTTSAPCVEEANCVASAFGWPRKGTLMPQFNRKFANSKPLGVDLPLTAAVGAQIHSQPHDAALVQALLKQVLRPGGLDPFYRGRIDGQVGMQTINAITAYQEAEGAGQILSALCGGRRWFVLHPDVDGDAYAAALQLMGQRGWAVPPGWP